MKLTNSSSVDESSASSSLLHDQSSRPVQASVSRNDHRTEIHTYYQNVGGINTCINDFLLACSDGCYDIIALTETWLDDRTLSSQVCGSNYEVFRTDRNQFNSTKSTGGGVLIAIHRRLKAQLIEEIAWSCVEQVWVSIKLSGRTLYFCVVYFPPDRTRDVALIDAHEQSVSAISSRALPVDEIVVVGDFNLPGLKWRSGAGRFLFADPVQSTFHVGTNALLDGYSSNLLQQINPISNENGRMLDLCFVSKPDEAPTLSAAPAPLVKFVPHHPPLHLTLEVSANSFSNVPATVYYDFNRADYDNIINVLLSIQWNEVLDKDDVDAAVQTFTNIMSYLIDRHVPKKSGLSSDHQPWQTTELRRLKTTKRAALRRYSKYRFPSLRNHYLRLNHQYKRASKRCHAIYLRGVQRKLKTHPKSFWKYVNEQRKESGLPSSMFHEGHGASDVHGICSMFSEKFSSVFSNERLSQDQISLASRNVPLLNNTLSRISVDDSMLESAFSKLKSSSSVGPDGIPALILKKCAVGLLSPLRHLFGLSLSKGVFPSLWKTAYIFPVHKKGDKRNVENYRGISALNAVSKLFELVAMEPIFSHCKQYISIDQHGFMPKRSTTTNLLSFTTYVADGMSNGMSQTDAIYTDLSAAFDKINHDIAVRKLDKLGFSGNILHWLKSYLIGRSLTVKIGDCLSEEFSATSGIPQGSHLGPLIFLIYFNDANLVLDGPRLSFADDMKLFFHVNSEADAVFLQRQLEIFHKWCVDNRMTLNPNKCSSISFSRRKEPIRFNYHLDGVPLTKLDCVKDLGVYLDCKLTFNAHVNYVVGKASRSLGFIMRIARDFTDVHCLKSLYCALVRSTLEYCSAIWNPHYLNGVSRIEAVQRRFIRFALRRLPWNNPHQLPSYESRCQLIGLDTLHVRRDLARALIVSDVLMAKTECPVILENINLQVQPRALRNHVFLRVPFRRTNYGCNLAVIGLQRLFNKVASGFDFHYSRSAVRQNFISLIRNFH